MKYVLRKGMNVCEQGSDFLKREIGRPACRSLEGDRNIKKVVWKVYESKTRHRKESENHDE